MFTKGACSRWTSSTSEAYRRPFARSPPLAVFTVALALTRDAAIAGYAMAAAAAVTFIVVTYPLTLLETPRSAHASLSSIGILFKNTAPLFVALFMFNLIENMPKFVMEGMLPYDNQLYFNALYFPRRAFSSRRSWCTSRLSSAWRACGRIPRSVASSI